jgi:4-hydroxy-tetrahydrodipicolinate reductase
MKIALIGYGKMGQAIENAAVEKGHEIVLRISSQNADELTSENLQKADVAIEFTNPQSAAANLKKCLDAGVPVVCGSTGWLNHLSDIENYCREREGTFLYASNFSIGVNLFFELNNYLAGLMSSQKQYDVIVEEIHHKEKKDAPSGTAIYLAKQILEHSLSKQKWVNAVSDNEEELQIISERIYLVPGTHKIKYHSGIDDIEIIHTAHNRKGFAEGALLAAEFISGKKGIYSMRHVLNI